MAPPDSVCAVSPAGVRPQSWEDDFSRINTICEKKKRQDGADCTKRADGAPHPSGDHAGALLLSSAAQRMLVHDNPNSSASGGGVMLGASSAMPQKRGSASADDGKVRDSRKSRGAHMHRVHTTRTCASDPAKRTRDNSHLGCDQHLARGFADLQAARSWLVSGHTPPHSAMITSVLPQKSPECAGAPVASLAGCHQRFRNIILWSYCHYSSTGSFLPLLPCPLDRHTDLLDCFCCWCSH